MLISFIISSLQRLYLKYLRGLAEKTDLGRVAGPSLLRLADESLSLSGRDASLNGRMSSEIWDFIEQRLEVYIVVFNYCMSIYQGNSANIDVHILLFHSKCLLSLQNLVSLAAIL